MARTKDYFIAAFQADGSEYTREYQGCYADFKAAMQSLKSLPAVTRIESSVSNADHEWATPQVWERQEVVIENRAAEAEYQRFMMGCRSLNLTKGTDKLYATMQEAQAKTGLEVAIMGSGWYLLSPAGSLYQGPVRSDLVARLHANGWLKAAELDNTGLTYYHL